MCTFLGGLMQVLVSRPHDSNEGTHLVLYSRKAVEHDCSVSSRDIVDASLPYGEQDTKWY